MLTRSVIDLELKHRSRTQAQYLLAPSLTPWCSYVLGSSEKQIVSDDQAFSLESRTEMENSLKQVTALSVGGAPLRAASGPDVRGCGLGTS